MTIVSLSNRVSPGLFEDQILPTVTVQIGWNLAYRRKNLRYSPTEKMGLCEKTEDQILPTVTVQFGWNLAYRRKNLRYSPTEKMGVWKTDN
jgi:hypothetical protein